jgi:ParB-like nuclease domain
MELTTNGHKNGTTHRITETAKLLSTLPSSHKFGRRELWLVPMANIEAWVNNPSARTENNRLKELKERMGADIGQLQPGAAVKLPSGRFRLVDGHRRFAILNGTDTTTFLVVVYLDVKPGSDLFGELFEAVNSGVRSVGIRERVWLALRGERKAAGDEASKIADELESWLDAKTLEQFINADCPVLAFRLAKAAVTQMGDRNIVGSFQNGEWRLSRPERHRLVARTLAWEIDHNQQQSLKVYLALINAAGSARKQKKMTKDLFGWICGGKAVELEGSRPADLDDEDDND